MLGVTDIIEIKIGISPLENVLSRHLSQLILQAREALRQVGRPSAWHRTQELNEKRAVLQITFNGILKRLQSYREDNRCLAEC